MKITDPPGIFSVFEDLDPAVYRAQRMAELEQIARYRAVRLAQFKAWADDEQRGLIQAKAASEERKARAEMAGKTVYIPPRLELCDMVSIVNVKKTAPKLSWYQKILAAFRRQ